MNTPRIESELSRRKFIGRTTLTVAALTALHPLTGLAQTNLPAAESAAPKRKIKIGQIGLGGRGSWIAALFAQHGGYEYHAVAGILGVPPERCFSGLSGFKRVIESGVEAIVLETPPYFFPEHAAAAVEAGLHVYMAKPVAVDVHGAMNIAASGRAATTKKRVFLVDYQIPTDPVNIEIRKRIFEGALGEMAYVNTFGLSHGFPDPPKGKTIENRLQHLIWVNDIALGCDNIGNFDIHALDAALWVLGRLPVAVTGRSRICRSNPHGDAEDVIQIVYEYADGLLHTHVGQALPNVIEDTLTAKFFGRDACAEVAYWGKSILRGNDKPHAGKVENLYTSGAQRNIATFHDLIEVGRCENVTAARARDGVLLCVLGREAAARKTRLTMDDLIKENKKLEADLTGLQA